MEKDEDRLIYRLTLHRNLVDWTIEQLANAQIAASRTYGNDRNGDILLHEISDIPQAKVIVQTIQNRYNPTS